LWGEARTLETAHLIFDYYEGDAEVIEEIAPRLEAAYLRVHEILQLNPDPERDPNDFYYGRKLTLKIVPVDTLIEGGPGLVYSISSPTLFFWQQSATTAAESYAAVLLTRLTTDLVTQAQNQLDYPARGWSEVEFAAIRWLVDDSLTTGYWQQQYGDALLPALLANYPTLRLDDLTLTPSGVKISFPQGGIHVASTSLIRYLVATEGRAIIPRLLSALVGEADTWEELIRALLGISLSDFEAGWNGWLAAEYPAVQEVLAVRTAIEASLAQEFAARTGDNPGNAMALVYEYLDPAAEQSWRYEYMRTTGIGKESLTWVDYEIVELVIEGDLARIRLHTTYNGPLMPEVVEGRFYRRVDERWLLTAPNPSAWGALYTMETEHFRVRYHALDAEIVKAATHKLEAAYQKMLRTLMLPEERTIRSGDRAFYDGKFNYEIVPHQVKEWSARATSIQIPSPFFYSLPHVDDSARDLAYSMMSHSAWVLLDDVYQVQNSWWSTLGLNQWILEDSAGPTWADSDYMAGLIQKFVDERSPVSLAELLYLSDINESFVAGRLLMVYIAAIHGRDEIPRFMHGLSQHEGWDELIPAVFGVTVEEFEAGWNQWIDTHYPPLPSP
jgi:hypothetical protein